MDKKIGLMIKAARVSKGLLAKEVAEQLNITPATIFNIEKTNGNGKLPPVLKYLLFLREKGADINNILDIYNQKK